METMPWPVYLSPTDGRQTRGSDRQRVRGAVQCFAPAAGRAQGDPPRPGQDRQPAALRVVWQRGHIRGVCQRAGQQAGHPLGPPQDAPLAHQPALNQTDATHPQDDPVVCPLPKVTPPTQRSLPHSIHYKTDHRVFDHQCIHQCISQPTSQFKLSAVGQIIDKKNQ
eukprot:scaffold237431_cov35-Prasinocladus_malaysianus.AAC.1